MSIGELHKHTCEAANAALSIVVLPRERIADAMKPRHFVEAFRRLDASLKAIKRLDVTDWPRTPGLTLARWAEPSALAVLRRFSEAVNAEAHIACQTACGRFPSDVGRDAADCREWMDATCKALEGIAWDKAPRTDVARIATYLDDEHERATRAAEPAPLPVTTAGEPTNLESRALAMLVQHPDWTDTRIAGELGCNRRTLYKLDGFTQAREIQKTAKDRHR